MSDANSWPKRRVPIDSLRQDPGNVRLHDAKNLASIARSLREFGQVEPLVVQARTGLVVGGNGRLEAMKSLGWAECDVTEVELTDAQAKALGVALNRTAELADWDEAGLAELLRSLQAADPDLALAAGFSDEEIEELWASLQEGADDPPAPEPEPKSEEVSFTATESQVKMVQLFLTVATFPKFQDMVEKLGGRWGLANATDTVFRALEGCCDVEGIAIGP